MAKEVFYEETFKGAKALKKGEYEACVFENCSLKHARTRFVNCQMEQVDFTEADLTAASFKDCNLAGAIFDNTQLAQADFSTALNFNINPSVNKLKGAKFSKEGLLGLVGGLGIEIVD